MKVYYAGVHHDSVTYFRHGYDIFFFRYCLRSSFPCSSSSLLYLTTCCAVVVLQYSLSAPPFHPRFHIGPPHLDFPFSHPQLFAKLHYTRLCHALLSPLTHFGSPRPHLNFPPACYMHYYAWLRYARRCLAQWLQGRIPAEFLCSTRNNPYLR